MKSRLADPGTLVLVVIALAFGVRLFHLDAQSFWYDEALSAGGAGVFTMGRCIPAQAGNRVFVTHFHETVEVEYKKRLTESFFQEATNDDSRQDLLAEYGISYVFHGPTERQIGSFDPSRVAYLEPTYSNPSVAIYRVNL